MRRMNNRTTVCAAVLALAAGIATLAAAAPTLRALPITDASGHPQAMTAATVEVPVGWRPEGGVVWNPGANCVGNKLRFDWRAISPDGRLSFEVLPGYSWQVQGTTMQTNPCPTRPMRSAQDFLAAVVREMRPGARVLQVRDRPDIVVARIQPNQQVHPQQRLRVESAQMLIAYHMNGTEYREVLGTTVDFTELQGNIIGGAHMVFAHRAPDGSLDFELCERMERSFRYEPAWGERTLAILRDSVQRFASAQRNEIAAWHAREMARINAQGAADRAAIRANTAREVAAIHAQTHAGTMATNDNIHRRTLESIGEYNTFRDVNGGTVRTSIHGGARVLRGANGSLFSTDDPYFNPAGSRELQRVR